MGEVLPRFIPIFLVFPLPNVLVLELYRHIPHFLQTQESSQEVLGVNFGWAIVNPVRPANSGVEASILESSAQALVAQGCRHLVDDAKMKGLKVYLGSPVDLKHKTSHHRELLCFDTCRMIIGNPEVRFMEKEVIFGVEDGASLGVNLFVGLQKIRIYCGVRVQGLCFVQDLMSPPEFLAVREHFIQLDNGSD